MAQSVGVTARRQPFAQAVLLVAVAAVTVAVSLIDTALITPEYLIGAAVVLVLTVAMLVVSATGSGAKGPVGSLWFALIPVLDILACALIRAAVVDELPTAGILVVFPVAWLSFAFPWPLIVAGIAGTGFATAYSFLRSGAGIHSRPTGRGFSRCPS